MAWLSVASPMVPSVTEDLERPRWVRLDPHSSTPGVPTILDADALLSSIRHHSLNDWPSRIARLSETGRLPVLASDHVYREVYKGLPKLAAGTGLAISVLRSCFETAYLPYIRWVSVARGYGHDDRVALVTDITDVPTAHLASLIAPCVVLSDDKSLRRPGFAAQQWHEVAGSTAAVVETLSDQEGLVLAVGLPTVGSVKAVTALSRRVQLPGWLGAAALAGGVLWLLADSRRRQVVGQVFAPLMEEYTRLHEEQQRALADLEEVVLQPTQPEGPKQMIATVLARGNEPMLAADIHQALNDRFPEIARPALARVRQILAEEPEFQHVQRYRWQLGVRARALSDVEFEALLKVTWGGNSTPLPGNNPKI